MQLSFYGGRVKLEDAYLGPNPASGQREKEKTDAGKGTLPWSPPLDRSSISALANALGSSIAGSIPVVSQLRQTNRLKEELEVDVEDEEEREDIKQAAAAQKREILTAATSVVVSIGAFVGFSLWYGVLG
jgi:hypothetical protein